MMWGLPTSVEINGENHPIRNNGDFRVILDCIVAFNDLELDDRAKTMAALMIFYQDYTKITDFEVAIKEMYKFIDNGKEIDENKSKSSVRLMDWEQDFTLISAPISRVIGKEVRSIDYLHWWSFLSAYMEIGECLFSQVISIRSKKKKGKKLEKHEKEFYRDNYNIVKLHEKLTDKEKEWLNKF